MTGSFSSALITGVCGFIGRALALRLAGNGVKVFGIGNVAGDADLTAAGVEGCELQLPDSLCIDRIREWQPDVVFHCAGSASPGRSVSHPDEDFASSVPVVFELLEGLRKHSPESHFVLLSSAAVYGQPERLPVSESAAIRPLSPYGYHKRLSELLCEQYSSLYGLRTTAARIFSAYGPGLKRQIVWDAFLKLRAENEGIFFGTGEETRDFIFIDDLVDALLLLADSATDSHRAINVASGEESSIAEIVELIAAHVETSGPWSFGGEEDTGAPKHWRADVSSLKALGFAPSVSLAAGIEQTTSWATEETAQTK